MANPGYLPKFRVRGNAPDAADARTSELRNMGWNGAHTRLLYGLRVAGKFPPCEDIEWFEQEECEDTRIRTIEAFEVENRQIQMKERFRDFGGASGLGSFAGRRSDSTSCSFHLRPVR